MSTCYYILTPFKLESLRERHNKENIDVPNDIKDLAGPRFINPYRYGAYYGFVQSLYLLGANNWHNTVG